MLAAFYLLLILLYLYFLYRQETHALCLKNFVIGYWLFNLGLIIFLFQTTSIMPFIFSWNLFLAIIPLFCVRWLDYLITKQKPVIYLILVSLLWLFFFPNAIYVVTDFIHLQNNDFYDFIPSVNYLPSQTIYSQQIQDWYVLIDLIGLYALGTYAGFASLERMLQLLQVRFHKLSARIVVPIISLLSGIGIYIGRFLRFNSWDIFNPVTIVKELLLNLNAFGYHFIALFTIYTLFGYLFYTLIKRH